MKDRSPGNSPPHDGSHGNTCPILLKLIRGVTLFCLPRRHEKYFVDQGSAAAPVLSELGLWLQVLAFFCESLRCLKTPLAAIISNSKEEHVLGKENFHREGERGNSRLWRALSSLLWSWHSFMQSLRVVC
jgi:hypothetical protein